MKCLNVIFGVLIAIYPGQILAQIRVLNFETFLRAYQANSSEFMTQKHKVSQSKINKTISDTNYTSSLSSNYFRNQAKDELQYYSSDSYNIVFEQKFGMGTSISNTIEKQGFGVLTQSSQSLTVSQSLWRNAFGHETKLKQQLSMQDLAVAQIQYQNAAIEICAKASETYVSLLIKQDQLDRGTTRLADSSRIFDRYKKLYSRNLVRKMDFLNAKDNYLKSKEEQVKLASAFYNELSSISVLINQPVDRLDNFSLEPQHYPQSQSSLLKSPTLIETQKQVSAAETSLELSSNSERSELQLFVRGERITSELKNNQEATAFGLSIDIPIANPQLKAKRLLALEKLKFAKISQEIAKRQTLQNFSKLDSEIKNLKKVQQERSLQLENAQVRLQEANRLLNNIQIEITDYLRYKQELRTIQDTIFSDNARIYLKSVQAQILHGIFPQHCQGILDE